ncbi:hypothetical protein AB0M44_49280 [Streptosporangium subroseum]|uniref:hypothetical protein n=1 Tax=Streptosporangium subroseum TaxID=106412 RepID=UPI00342205DE
MAVTAFVVAVLGRYGVSGRDMAFFGAYVALGIALPGTLIMRALYGGKHTLAEEISLGLALGYAVEVVTYIVARSLGMPLLVLVWPVTTYALFLAIPRLRAHWRNTHRPATPTWWSWALALVIVYLVAWGAHDHFSAEPLSWPELGDSRIDLPFHLALIGELKHHMPPTVPMVAGEPLVYHWFVYAHLAAASWVSGVEPLVLLLRLAMFPMLAAFVVLMGLTGRRVMGSWAGALVAVVGTIFVGAPRLYLGSLGTFTYGGVHDSTWGSPTQTLGTLLFAPVVLLLVDLLERRRHGAGLWCLLAFLLMTVMGVKATYLPMLAAGLLAVAAVEVVRRRPPWRALAALAMTSACLLYAQFVLFGGTRQGMLVAPFSFMRVVWRDLTGAGAEVDPPLASVIGVTAVYLLCWAVTWCGVLGLLSRRRLLARPAVVLMLGIGAAGLSAVLLFEHPGRSQLYFLWGSYPYAVTVAVYGLLVITRRARVSLRAVACAAGAGLAAAYLIPVLCGVEAPLGPGQADTALYRPYIALVIVAALVAAVLAVTRGRLQACALTIIMMAAIGLPAAGHARVLSFAQPLIGGVRPEAAQVQEQAARTIPLGALTAGRWLRDHSRPDELVATNTHCRWGLEDPCDSRQFWLAALSERRMLVEGWAYTSTNVDRWSPGRLIENLPFWDEERFRANETAFLSPSANAIEHLRDRYGVRWLMVDERRAGPDSRIGDFARFRFRSGDYAIYQVREPGL